MKIDLFFLIYQIINHSKAKGNHSLEISENSVVMNFVFAMLCFAFQSVQGVQPRILSLLFPYPSFNNILLLCCNETF